MNNNQKRQKIAEKSTTNYDELDPQSIFAIRTLQSTIRQRQRFSLHRQIYHQRPNTFQKYSLFRTDELAVIPNNRLREIVILLSAQHAIIDNNVYHWTTLKNLKNIIKHKKFLGNKALKQNNIDFDGNSLMFSDIKNGDGNIICFSPFLVCTTALRKLDPRNNTVRLRDNLIRLSINLNNIDQFSNRYLQLFKIYDFGGIKFASEIKITDELTINICNKIDGLSVQLQLGRMKEKVYIKKSENIFYGNLTQINLFCLLTFFQCIKRLKNETLKDALLQYLNKCDENLIKKILICFSQNLTINAECNFNTVLPLLKDTIKAVYIPNQQIIYNITDAEEPSKILDTVAAGEFSCVPSTLQSKPLHTVSCNDDDTRASRKKYVVNQYGYHTHPISNDLWNCSFDYRSIPSKSFNEDHYIETRYGQKFIQIDPKYKLGL